MGKKFVEPGKELSEELTQKIIDWNNIDQKIFEKANSTFWSRYNKIPNLELLKNEFKIETGESQECQLYG